MPEQVQTRYGKVTVETPRDRDGSFEPQTVKKRETILAEGMAAVSYTHLTLPTILRV